MADDNDTMVHTYEPNASAPFVMVIAQEGVRTVDGREFAAGAIDWRDLPMPLMLIRENDPTGRGGHKASKAVGTIAEMWREDNDEGFGTIYGKGYFSTDEYGEQARQLIKEGIISGVSADVGGAIVEELEATDEGLRKIIRRGTIVAVTALPIPAFDATKISAQDPEKEAVLASAGVDWKPESGWFVNPRLTAPTPITVTADGQIYGHAALWGTCHIGYRDRCVTPPHSKTNYQYFNVGTVLTADGESVHVGRLTAGTGHAAIEFGAQPAKDHYDNTGFAAAYVHSGEDEHGIWFAGSIAPHATPEQIQVLRASSVSGDWRAINGGLELVGILAVNTPGFPVPLARAGLVAGAQVSLIASGICGCENEELAEEAEIVEIAAVEEEVEIIKLGFPVVEELTEEQVPEIDVEAALRRLDIAMFDSELALRKSKKKDCGCGCGSC